MGFGMTVLKMLKTKLIRVVIPALIFVVLVATGLAGWQYLANYAYTPADPRAAGQVLQVLPGSGINAVSRMLARRNITDSAFKFRVLFYIKNRHARIKAGEYNLSAAMSPAEILNVLVEGKVALHRLTIPEGYTIKQISSLVDASGLATGESLLRAATAGDFLSALGIAADSAEGYLFPETYFFPKTTTAEEILTTLIRRFQAVFSREWAARAKDLGFSVHQIVTLASIIEKETAAPQERPLVASVFHNRLKRGMRLESDPTVIYGIPDFNGNITRAHLNTLTPYNTYRISGLPPGPIANPGKAALEAALYPADTGFFYFVSTGGGTHYFSTNFTDHNRAVRKYQLRR